MLSPRGRRLRRMVAAYHELQALQLRLLDLAKELQQDVADAKADVEAEERAEQALRAAARLGV